VKEDAVANVTAILSLCQQWTLACAEHCGYTIQGLLPANKEHLLLSARPEGWVPHPDQVIQLAHATSVILLAA